MVDISIFAQLFKKTENLFQVNLQIYNTPFNIALFCIIALI